MVILFSILAIISLIMLIIGLINPSKSLFWLKPEKRKKSIAVICYGLALIIFCIIAVVIHNREAETVTVETVSIEETESYDGISNISVQNVTGGTDNKVVGQRGQAYFDPQTMTADSLSAFYNNVVANSGYDYYTLINNNDNTKGIVFAGCGIPAYYGTLDSNGAIADSSIQFDPAQYSADILK